MRNASEFLEALVAERGVIVSSADCSELEIAYARACKRMYVDANGMGFVLRSGAWLTRAEAFLKADYLDCLDMASQIAAAVEAYDGDDLLSQIVPKVRPLVAAIKSLQHARDKALQVLDKALGDTDLPNDDESPLFRAYVALRSSE